jgi:DNA-binding NarL/FixJ family response regulator/tRNA A-37 threonylcarbamoyl transferase component Bud32
MMKLTDPQTQHLQSGQLRVVIVDDEPINRIGLKWLLASFSKKVEVVAEACNGQEAVRFAQSLQPDVILMDITMPNMDGISATEMIRKTNTSVKILMLTSRNSERDIQAAIEAGANGYCLKDASPERFMTALEVIRDGNLFLDSSVLHSFKKVIASGAFRKTEIDPSDTLTYKALSENELEIMALKMKGLDDAEAADTMRISLESFKDTEIKIKAKIIELESRAISNGGGRSDSIVKICEVCELHFPYSEIVCPKDGSTLVSEALRRPTGSTVAGKFEILGFIGRGGGATVYKARHKFLNQLMAIKIIHAEMATDFRMLQRFRYEAEAASHLNHPNIVRVHDFGITDTGTPYLAMEYLEGMNLSTHLKEVGPLSKNQLITIFWQICAALEHAHSNGLVHRDVKPSNIFLSYSQHGEVFAKLVDFGLAKSTVNEKQMNVTQHGQIVGTPWYMSPESCRAQDSTAASDIYSLGCTLYECVTGKPPFIGVSVTDVMFKHLSAKPAQIVLREDASRSERQLARLINKCLQKDPTDRYSAIAEVKAQLFEMMVNLQG